MDHVAIDLGGRKSQICVRDASGTIVEEKRCATKELKAYLSTRPLSRVVVETSAESFKVADVARELGHEVRVVPATLVRQLGVGARRTKTDRRDAQVLSEVSTRIDLPSVHVPSSEARRRKTLCGMRDALVSSRTRMINTVRGWLRTEGWSSEVTLSATATFTERVRRFWQSHRANEMPACVARQLRAIDALTTEIEEADAELRQRVAADPVCRRLETVEGVGPVTALRFAATVDDIGRFPTAHRLQSYLGLVPGEDSSSERQRRTSITKAGPSALRWSLVQAAHCCRRSRRRGPLQTWAEQIEQRRGKRIATVALARKLAGILFAMWRDGTEYDPMRSARKEDATTTP